MATSLMLISHIHAHERSYLGVSGCIARIWTYLGVSVRIWVYLGVSRVSGRIWAYLDVSVRIWAYRTYLGVSGRICAYLGISRVSERIWAYLCVSEHIARFWTLIKNHPFGHPVPRSTCKIQQHRKIVAPFPTSPRPGAGILPQATGMHPWGAVFAKEEAKR